MTAIGDIAEFIRGVTFKSGDTTAEPESGSVAILRAGNIQDGRLLTDTDLVFLDGRCVSDKQLLRPGDFVMCTSSGSPAVLGKVARLSDPSFRGSAGAFCAIIRPNTELIGRYLLHWFNSPVFLRWRDSRAQGVNIQNLRVSELSALPVDLPGENEQRRIADILDQADALRRKQQEADRLGNDYVQSVFKEMFGDPVTNTMQLPMVELGNVCSRLTVGHVGSMADEYVEDGIPFLRSLNVRRGRIESKDLKFVSKTFHARLKKTVLRPKDVVSVRTGKPGVTAVIPDEMREANCADLIVITCNDRIIPEYLAEVMNQMLGDKETIKGTVGAVQGHFNIKTARKLLIPLPETTEQEKFLSLLRKAVAILRRGDEAQSCADDVFGSLSKQFFG